MEILYYIFLGFIQGITEPIPVSSSGHILIIKNLLENFTESVSKIDFETFATITNFGSFLAIILIFRKDIIRLVTNFFKYLNKKNKKEEYDFKYCWFIVLATIPAGIMGLFVSMTGLFDKLEENVKIIGLMLVITAFFLYLIKDFKGKREELTLLDALTIGFSQVIALMPGISRSGTTITGAMFSGLKREVAFNFSFMLYIPISIATMILGVKDLLEISISGTIWIYYIVGAVVSFIFTYISTLWFRNLVKNGKLMVFSWYCLIVGTLVVLFM